MSRQKLYDRFGGKCFYCQRAISYEESSIDHLFTDMVQKISASDKLPYKMLTK